MITRCAHTCRRRHGRTRVRNGTVSCSENGSATVTMTGTVTVTAAATATVRENVRRSASATVTVTVRGTNSSIGSETRSVTRHIVMWRPSDSSRETLRLARLPRPRPGARQLQASADRLRTVNGTTRRPGARVNTAPAALGLSSWPKQQQEPVLREPHLIPHRHGLRRLHDWTLQPSSYVFRLPRQTSQRYARPMRHSRMSLMRR